MVKIKKTAARQRCLKAQMKKMFKTRCGTLDQSSQSEKTLTQIGSTTQKAAATKTECTKLQSSLTGKENRSLAINSHLAFETKANF